MAAASRCPGSPAPASSLAAVARRRAMVFAMHQIQVGTIVRHLDGAPGLRGLPARAVRGAAADRLGHLGDRHRRRHGPLDRRRDAHRRPAARAREARADGQLRRALRRPVHDRPPLSRRRGRRSGAGAQPRRPDRARAGRYLGHDRDARHLLARIRRPRQVRARAGPGGAVLDGHERVAGAALAHLLVVRVAGDRDRRVRARALVRPRGGAPQSRRAGARRAWPVARDERADDAASRGSVGAARVRRGQRRARPRAAGDNGLGACASTTSSSPPPSRRRESAWACSR